MRRVVAYNKRHLAQEGKAKQDPNSKSAKSLKNWGKSFVLCACYKHGRVDTNAATVGHDPQKS